MSFIELFSLVFGSLVAINVFLMLWAMKKAAQAESISLNSEIDP